MTQAVLALGFVGVMAASTPVTATAQQINFSGLGFSDPGVDVEIGNRPASYQNYRQYRDFDNHYYYAFDHRPRTQRYYSDGTSYQTGSVHRYRRAFDIR